MLQLHICKKYPINAKYRIKTFKCNSLFFTHRIFWKNVLDEDLSNMTGYLSISDDVIFNELLSHLQMAAGKSLKIPKG